MSFRQINKATGNRLRQQLVDEVTREPVEAGDKGRGYEVDKGIYVEINDEELEAIEIESTRTIKIDKMVPRDQVDLRYLDSPYYIVPNDDVGQDAFAVIREAMRGKDLVGVGRVVISKRERPIIIEPFGKGMRGITLRYPYEVRDEADYFDDIDDVKVDPEMLEIAEMIVEKSRAGFDPAAFEDRYEVALLDLLQKKQKGMPLRHETPFPAAHNVVSLMDALKRSVAIAKSGKSAPAPAARGGGESPSAVATAKLRRETAKGPPPRKRKSG